MVTRNTHRNVASLRQGFTLIEILTVVIILGIASAVIAPQIGSRDDLRAVAAARVLMADLMFAQNSAIAQQKWMYVKFDVDAENYRVLDAAGPSGGDNTMMHPVNKDPFIMQLGPSGVARLTEVKIKSAVFNGVGATYQPEFTLAFDELGVPHAYGYDEDNTSELLNATVVLESGAHTVTVTIERDTGEIKVQ